MTSAFDKHICLVGLSGSGKSTLGPILASQLNLGTSVDLDQVVERRLRAPASQIFAEQGEALFRQYESEALAEALAGPPVVIAAGGGIVLDQANRTMLKGRATVIWLQASVPDLVERLSDSEGSRPLLSGDVEFALNRLAEERHALYASVADLSIDVGGMDPQTLAEAVVEALR